MSRRIQTIRRALVSDYKFGDKLVSQFVNSLVKRGKRSTAERMFYGALDLLEKKSGQESIEVFHKALNNVKPVLEVKSRRIGGSTYQVPVEVRGNRRTALAIRWIISYAKARNEKSMSDE